MTVPTKQPRQPAARRSFKRQPIIGTVVVLVLVTVWCYNQSSNKGDPQQEPSFHAAAPLLTEQRVLQSQEQQLRHPTTSLSTAASRHGKDTNVKTVTRESVLVVAFNASRQEQAFSIVGNDIQEFFDKHDPAIHRAGTDRPVVLRGFWKPPSEDWQSKESFLKTYGHIPYYIKDRYVQVKEEQCVAQFRDLWDFITSPSTADSAHNDKTNTRRSLLAFTNDKENRALFGEQGERLPFDIPAAVQHIDSFTVLSTMTRGQSHEFHRHGESWIAQAVGHKIWWFLPPSSTRPPKVNACDYLNGKETPPAGVATTLQSPGDVIWFPHDYYHATCSLTEWNVGIGRQLGPRINQNFKTLPETVDTSDPEAVQERLQKCSGESSGESATMTLQKSTVNSDSPSSAKDADWKWYDGDIGKYYDDLEVDHKRNPKDINDYAVHRWLGEKRSTQIHYELIHEAVLKHHQKATAPTTIGLLNVLDAGCGLGSALMWMEKKEPTWTLHGRTLSEEQANFVKNKLPQHSFQVKIDSYDNLEEGTVYDAIYSIEAAIHSTDIKTTFKAWSDHLDPKHGVVVIIDDFLQPSAKRDDKEVDLFARSWLANSLYTVTELNGIAREVGLTLVESRDLLAEYRIVELNYRNQVLLLDPDHQRNHQGWMGSKYRQKLTVEGKLGYNLLVFRKA